jgi:hypothetical protein
LKQARVRGDVYEKLRVYAEGTDKSITNALNEALDDWLDTIGAARLEAAATPYVSTYGQTLDGFNHRVLQFPTLNAQGTA